MLLQEGIGFRVAGIDEITVEKEIGGRQVDIDVVVVELVAEVNKYASMNCFRKAVHYLVR